MRYDRDLVVAADGGENRADAGIGERRIDVRRPFPATGTELARRREFHRDQTRSRCQPPHRLLMHGRGESGGSERRGENRDPVARIEFRGGQLQLRMINALIEPDGTWFEATRRPDVPVQDPLTCCGEEQTK